MMFLSDRFTSRLWNTHESMLFQFALGALHFDILVGR